MPKWARVFRKKLSCSKWGGQGIRMTLVPRFGIACQLWANTRTITNRVFALRCIPRFTAMAFTRKNAKLPRADFPTLVIDARFRTLGPGEVNYVPKVLTPIKHLQHHHNETLPGTDIVIHVWLVSPNQAFHTAVRKAVRSRAQAK